MNEVPRHRRGHHPPLGTPVKLNILTAPSLVSIILLPLHVGGDVALGFDQGGSGLVFVVLPILLVMACGALLLAERRSGHVIMLLGGLVALGMPIIHRNNGFTAAVAKSPGGLFFIWTLMALGVAGGLATILSARGLWDLRSRQSCDSRLTRAPRSLTNAELRALGRIPEINLC